VFVENLTETILLGKEFAQKLDPKSIVLLEGPIGSGKTSFVKGIAEGLLITDQVTSPTFALSHHYKSGKIPLIHLDLYRLENKFSAIEFFAEEEEEANEIGAILVIEWPQLIKPFIDKYWKIEINYNEDFGRNYTIWDPKNSLT
tara:strand:- start:323 stop:754 length:432 start_codon:yes stop_codon:yes gene_type:complete